MHIAGISGGTVGLALVFRCYRRILKRYSKRS